MNTFRTALILGAILLLPGPALAEGFYIGASGGQSNMDVDINMFEGSDTAGKVFAGYRFNDYIAAEAFYADFGEASNPFLAMTATAYGAQLVTIVPIGSRLEIFGKVGADRWDAEFLGIGGFTDDGIDVTYGGGLAINITDWLAIRGEWEAYEFETSQGFNVDTQMLSAGIQYNF